MNKNWSKLQSINNCNFKGKRDCITDLRTASKNEWIKGGGGMKQNNENKMKYEVNENKTEGILNKKCEKVKTDSKNEWIRGEKWIWDKIMNLVLENITKWKIILFYLRTNK